MLQSLLFYEKKKEQNEWLCKKREIISNGKRKINHLLLCNKTPGLTATGTYSHPHESVSWLTFGWSRLGSCDGSAVGCSLDPGLFHLCSGAQAESYVGHALLMADQCIQEPSQTVQADVISINDIFGYTKLDGEAQYPWLKVDSARSWGENI